MMRRMLAALLVGVTAASAAAQSAKPRGQVRAESFFSKSLGVEKQFIVYLPPSYETNRSRRYPVAYYLHGLFGGEADWVAKGGIDLVADSLIAAGMPQAIIVMPDGDDGWYTTWANPVSYGTCADTLHVEAPARYCVRSYAYDEYIGRDLVAYVDSHFRTSADRAHRGIGGLSMGGYGAMAIAFKFPTEFAAAASHSGVVSPMYIGAHPFAAPARYGESFDTLVARKIGFLDRYRMFFGTDMARWRANDPATLVAGLKQAGTALPALYADVGTDDGLLDQNRAFDWELTRLGIAHEYHEYPGAHTWRFWNDHVRQSLPWMLSIIGR